MGHDLSPAGSDLQGVWRALGSAAIGSLAGLVGGVLICAAAVQLTACGTAAVPVTLAAAQPTPWPASSAASATDEVCDPGARLCR
jgi:hypothetical protein